MQSSRGRRWGWTLVEVLVLGLVGVIALGLVVAFIFRSRQPAQRIECAMHLERQGTAIRLFHDQRKTLPAACIAPAYATWAVQIAPFLPQDYGKSLADWNLELSYYDQTAAVREAQVWVYFCPARRAPTQLSLSGDSAPTGKWNATQVSGALGDYACAPGIDAPDRPWTSADADGAIILGKVLEKKDDRIVRWTSLTTVESLKRGQANTILVGEKHVARDTFGQTAQGDGSVYNGDHYPSFARLIDKKHPLAQAPTDPFDTNFGSWHNGLCQFLMADNSVRSFTNDVNVEVVVKLIPRNLPP